MQIRIPVPQKIPSDWKAYFMGFLSQLKPAFDFDLEDERGILVPGTTQIFEVAVEEDYVELSYKYTWEVYEGCKDNHFVAEELLSVIGNLDGNSWVFEKHITPERRSTFEEF